MNTPPENLRKKEIFELFRTQFKALVDSIKEIGPCGDNVEIKENHSRLTIGIHMPTFQLLMRQEDSDQRFNPKISIALCVDRVYREAGNIHTWFTNRLKEKLNSPMLDLAFDFDWLGVCFVEGYEKGKDGNDVPKAHIDEAPVQKKRRFPNESAEFIIGQKDHKKEPKFIDAYLDFVKALVETIGEFWNTHGRAILEKFVAAEQEKLTGGTGDAVKKTLE